MLYIFNPKSLILILKTDVMKKILVILMAALFVLPMTGVSASFSGKSDVDSLKTIEEDNRLFEIMQIKSQSSVKQLLKAKSKWMKQLGKVMKKRSKLTTKKLEKDGWRSYGTNKELDHSLLCHYQLLYDGGMMGLDYVREFVGFGYSESATEAKKMAFYGVCDLFAQDVKSEIIWRDNYSYNGELVSFYAAFERFVAYEFGKALVESFAIVCDSKNGALEMQVFYLIECISIRNVCERALKLAADEANLPQEHIEKISQIIQRKYEFDCF